MARTRAQNKRANTSAVYNLELTNSNLVLISWLLVQKEGLGQQESRYVANIVNELDLEKEMRFETKEQLQQSSDFELAGYEVKYMVDELNRLWTENKMPPNRATAAVSLFDYLEEVLKTPAVEKAEEG